MATFNWRYSEAPADLKARDAMFQGETSVFPQPLVNSVLAAERRRIQGLCFNDAFVSPESLIQRAIEPPIDFIDLFAYHAFALNPRAEEFHGNNPHAKVVHVSMEFKGFGRQVPCKPDPEGVVRFNKFLINYDALALLKRLQPESVGFINIDFPDLEKKKAPIVAEAARTLRKGGCLSFYVDKGAEEETISKLKVLGFSNAETKPMEQENTDFLYRERHLEYNLTRILATR